MNKTHALLAAAVLLGLAGVASAEWHHGAHGGQNNECCDRPRGLLPWAFGFKHDAAAEGYNGYDVNSGYAGPEVYGYWNHYGWFGPQYGAWYGPGGFNYYARTGDYAAPYLPPPSMRGPPPGTYPPPY